MSYTVILRHKNSWASAEQFSGLFKTLRKVKSKLNIYFKRNVLTSPSEKTHKEQSSSVSLLNTCVRKRMPRAPDGAVNFIVLSYTDLPFSTHFIYVLYWINGKLPPSGCFKTFYLESAMPIDHTKLNTIQYPCMEILNFLLIQSCFALFL